mmetsp:Transcript_59994/g.167385  ORF Transcript_59994/g.167385 Transcript_59994/m.167385 type:complete len:237 (+) Transcript_59994:1583-2293(+)
MNYGRVAEAAHRLQELLDHHSDHAHAHATEVVLLQHIKKVNTEQLKDDAEVFAEHKKVEHANDPTFIIWVELQIQPLQYSNLHGGLVQIGRPILDDFQSDGRTTICLAFQYLAERAPAKKIDDLVRLAPLTNDSIPHAAYVVVLRVVIATIVHASRQLGQDSTRGEVFRVPELARAARKRGDKIDSERLQEDSMLALLGAWASGVIRPEIRWRRKFARSNCCLCHRPSAPATAPWP